MDDDLTQETAGMSSRDAALVLDNVSKSFGGKTVLSAVDLTLRPGEIHALLGQNGSGKSTLIKVLSGYHAPDEGSAVTVAGQPLTFGSPASSQSLGCRFVHQDLGLIGSETILDNLAVGVGYPTSAGTILRGRSIRRAKEALAKVGLDLDPRLLVRDLSPAQQTGVAVARAMNFSAGSEPRVLVLDEPTATLPIDEVEHLLSIVRKAADTGIAIIYVTHHLGEVFQIAERVSVLRDGHLIASLPVAGLERPELIHLLTGAELELAYRDEQHVSARLEQGATHLDVRGLSAGPIIEATFTAHAGEVVGVYGITGSGRETLLGSIFGARPREGGEVFVDGRALPAENPPAAVKRRVGYLPPDRKIRGGIMNMTARENFTILNIKAYWSRLRVHKSAETRDARDWFGRLDVRPSEAYEADLASFSGGNQQKVLLAKWLMQEPLVLLLDEPTQGVDIGAKAMIHRQVLAAAESGAAVVISSSDEEEVAALCSRVLVMQFGRIVDQLEGQRLTVRELNRSLHRETPTSPFVQEAS
jgi:ribose transport system ATP-binding protein